MTLLQATRSQDHESNEDYQDGYDDSFRQHCRSDAARPQHTDLRTLLLSPDIHGADLLVEQLESTSHAA